MEKPIAETWRTFLASWPASFTRKGVLVSSEESIAFNDFLLSDDFVILERPTPDSVGARRVALPFSKIEAIKYTEPLRTKQFLDAGFIGQQAAKPTAVSQPVPAIAAK